MGDPSGIGPEVTLKALASPGISGLAFFYVIGDASVIERESRALGIKLNAELLDMDNVSRTGFAYAKSKASFGNAAVEYLDKAVETILSGGADCLVTAPINKDSIRKAGFGTFQGHTEYLAKKTRTREFAMMFVGEAFKITLVTRHVALRDVPRALTSDKICGAIALTGRYLREYFGISDARIGVAGLNPHAGENGAFGDEEARIIVPAIKRASRSLGRIYGPIPPDVIFHSAYKGAFDAVISMYHDQALIPFKLLYFESGVNLTLGLPFVRTSPDHGTAFDIAGKGIADASSMEAAIRLACRLSQKLP